MVIEPGELLARGRAADVFVQGDGTVLRRYRAADRDCGSEAAAMAWLKTMGFPVPAVLEAAGRDLLMEHIEGPTMLADLGARPWMAVSHMRTLARIQQTLNAIAAPVWIRRDRRIPGGSAVVHLDLHPMNVILSPAGPVVIDWTNVGRGDGDFDGALSFVLMATFETHGMVEHGAQVALTRLFRWFRGRRGIDRHLAAAAAVRFTDPNVTAAERAAIGRMLARHQADR